MPVCERKGITFFAGCHTDTEWHEKIQNQIQTMNPDVVALERAPWEIPDDGISSGTDIYAGVKSGKYCDSRLSFIDFNKNTDPYFYMEYGSEIDESMGELEFIEIKDDYLTIHPENNVKGSEKVRAKLQEAFDEQYYNSLIVNRDKGMASSLKWLNQNHSTVACIVGYAHLAGLINYIPKVKARRPFTVHPEHKAVNLKTEFKLKEMKETP